MHTIGKTTFDVRAGGNYTEALAIQQAVQRVWEETVVPALDAAFNRLADAETVIRANHIDIQVSGLNLSDWQTELPDRIVAALLQTLEKQLITANEHGDITRQSVSEQHFHNWLFYLENGYLPVTANVPESARWQQMILAHVAVVQASKSQLLRLLQQKRDALQRLIWQHPATFLEALARAITGQSTQPAMDVARDMHSLLQVSRAQLKTAAKEQQHVTRKHVAGHATTSATPIFTSNGITPAVWSAWRDQWLEAFFYSWWQTTIVPERSFDAAIVLQQVWNNWLPAGQNSGVTQALVQALLQATQVQRPGHAVTQALVQWQQAVGQPNTAADAAHKVAGATSGTVDQAGKSPQPPLSEVAKKAGTKTIEATDKTAQTPKAAPKEAPKATQMPPLKEDPMAPPDAFTPLSAALEDDGLYVNNAGVVLLHPYLKPLFVNLGLMYDSAKFKDKKAQRQAVYVLHYLSTGSWAAPEYELVLAKYLCGLSVKTPLPPMKPYSARQRRQTEQEIKGLLESVIRHWGALGNASAAALQEGFLQRAGKLSNGSLGATLTVEKNTLDILLGRLPWSLGLVKLPWMTEFLQIEWT